MLFIHHPDLSIELLSLFYNHYIDLIPLYNNNVNMSPSSSNGSGNNPLGSSNNPLGSSNSGPPNPNNKPYQILEPEPSDKNSKRKRPNNNPDPLPDYESLGKKSDRKRPYYRLDFTKGKGKCIRWYYYDEKENREISPEGSHTVHPVYNPELTVRAYVESGLTYTYDCRSENPSDHYCKIQYPDNSSCTMYDKLRVIQHIKLHQDNKWEEELFKDVKNFDESYKKFFDKNNKERIKIWLSGKK